MKSFAVCFAKSRMRFLGVASAVLGIMASSAAGTYTVTGVQWVTTGVGLNGGYINLTGSYDVSYGIASQLNAPMFKQVGQGPPTGYPNLSNFATVMGVFRWVVQWQGAPGEPAPLNITGTAEYKGTSTASCDCTLYYGGPYVKATVSTADIFPCSAAVSTATPGVPRSDPETTPVTSPQFVTVGGSFTVLNAQTNTYIGYFNVAVNSSSSLTAIGLVNGPSTAGVANSYASLAVTVRLTQVAGQTVNPNL
jgi:hypothetical protein